MEMVAAQSGSLGQLIEFGQRIGTLNHPAYLGHCFDMALALRGATRLAALARSKSAALGIGAGIVKRDILAKRQTRRTCRTAIHAGRRYRINELAVGVRVTFLQGNPALLIGGVWAPRGCLVPLR